VSPYITAVASESSRSWKLNRYCLWPWNWSASYHILY